MRNAMLIPLALAVASCGASGVQSSQKDLIGNVTSAEAMRDALARAGLQCSDYRQTEKNDRSIDTQNATDVARCDMDGESIELVVWKDRGQVENWQGVVKKLHCSVGQALGVVNVDYVAADTWTIANVSRALAGKIAEAVGGTAHHEDLSSCSDTSVSDASDTPLLPVPQTRQPSVSSGTAIPKAPSSVYPTYQTPPPPAYPTQIPPLLPPPPNPLQTPIVPNTDCKVVDQLGFSDIGVKYLCKAYPGANRQAWTYDRQLNVGNTEGKFARPSTPCQVPGDRAADPDLGFALGCSRGPDGRYIWQASG